MLDILKSLDNLQGRAYKYWSGSSIYVAVIVVQRQLLQLEDAKEVAGNV